MVRLSQFLVLIGLTAPSVVSSPLQIASRSVDRVRPFMLRRMPRCLIWGHIGCLQTASIHAQQDASNAIRSVASAAGQQHAHVTQHLHDTGGSSSSWKWQTWPAVLGLAAATAAWQSQHSTALADSHRPDKVQAVMRAAALVLNASACAFFISFLMSFNRCVGWTPSKLTTVQFTYLSS